MDEDPESPTMELCSRPVTLEFGVWLLDRSTVVADAVPGSGLLGLPAFPKGSERGTLRRLADSGQLAAHDGGSRYHCLHLA